MTDQRILRLLLAENDRECEAPPDVEARLRREFRAHRTKLARRRRAVWTATATLAAGLVMAAMLMPRIPAPGTKPSKAGPAASTISTNERSPIPEPASKHQRPLQAAYAGSESSPARAPKVVSSVVRPSTLAVPPKVAPAPEAQAAETVTDFFPLLDPAPPFERGEILRVNVPASVMRTVGLPVREERMSDRVQADILVGEEGLPRAIRFVSNVR